MENLFSYGTLQKEKVQLKIFGRKLNGSADLLEGYIIASIEITDQRFLAKGEDTLQRTLVATSDKNDIVEGTVLQLSLEELYSADQYEPDNYKRIKVKLQSGIKAWIYVAV